MRRPAVFFDRDNTLIIGNDYLGDPAKVSLVLGAGGAVARCRSLGFAVVVVSNQSGVARGMFSEDDVRRVNQRMDEMLIEHNAAAVIDRHEYCPFHPQGTVDAYKQDSFLRKPKPGMILAAAEAMALDLARSWVVGDAPRDVAAGKAAGCRTILIIDPSLAPSPAALEQSAVKAEFTVGSLVEAVEVIAEQTERVARSGVERPAAQKPPAQAPIAQAPVTQTSVAKDFSIRAPESKPAAPFPATSTATSTAPKPAAIASPKVSQPAAPAVAQTPALKVERKPAPETLRVDTSRVEALAQQILIELKKQNEARHDDFSISKLIAGIMQILAIATVPLAYLLYQGNAQVMTNWLLAAVFFQTFTVALLIMGRQK